MARKGEQRVNDIYKYDVDVKGKRIIRLTAGVGSGKNYWIGQIAKENPELRILVITSRKNTVIVQASKMNAGTFLDLDRLIDDDEEIWGEPIAEALRRVVCTNAGIEKYFKKRFDANDEFTHLWRKFDLIVLDEAHSLATDATFTDAFYTEWFIKYTVNKNPNCDVVVMSGTQEPIDWMFKGNIEKFVHDLNCFEKCIHLEPDIVRFVPQAIVPGKMHQLWRDGKRIIYFANHRNAIAQLTKELMRRGVPAEALGFSFNNPSEVASKFPDEIGSVLKDKVDEMNKNLTEDERVPSEVRILFTTSKNKEGISILDDDIKIVFAETHNKAELKQIAGRVRGNVTDGKGISTLAIVRDAQQHSANYSKLEVLLSKNAIDGLNRSLEEYKEYCESIDKAFELEQFLEAVYRKYDSVRYDYVAEEFRVYKGRIYGQKQHAHDCREFEEIIDNIDVPAFTYSRTGWDIFRQEWFPWSKVYPYKSNEELKEVAREKFHEYLVGENLLNTVIKKDKREKIGDQLRELAEVYGYDCLGFKENFKSVGKAIRKLDYQIEEVSSGVSYRIRDLREKEK